MLVENRTEYSKYTRVCADMEIRSYILWIPYINYSLYITDKLIFIFIKVFF